MLGSAFVRALGSRAVLIERDHLDITKPAAIMDVIANSTARVLINCAAHVDAEAAETDPDPVVAANVILPGLLAQGCRRAGMTIVHFSSTGCYGSWKATPYTEEDEANPTTAHHKTKIAGENSIRHSGCEHVILRTGWLFGGRPAHKKNFVWRRLLEAAGAREMKSDRAQFGNPTWVDDVVKQTLHVLELRLRGTYNCVAHGGASRFDYVERIVAASGFECRLVPSGPFVRRAPVSSNEMAYNYRLGLMGQDLMRPWRDTIDDYVATLRQSQDWQILDGIREALT